MSVRQSKCGVCGKKVPLGKAIVRDFGKGGRVHKSCLNLKK